MMTKRMIENGVTKILETWTFEELLEYFDIDPVDVFWDLFTQGQIDQELMERIFDVE